MVWSKKKWMQLVHATDGGASFMSYLDPYSECEPMAYDAEASCTIVGIGNSEDQNCGVLVCTSHFGCIIGWFP